MRCLLFAGHRLPVACAVVALVLSATGVASAAISAKENFSYADGPLAGNNGGSGWADAWSSSDTNGQIVGGVYENTQLGGTENIRTLSNPIGAEGTTVFWMSFVARSERSGGWAGVHLYDSTFNTHTSTTNPAPDHFSEPEKFLVEASGAGRRGARALRQGAHQGGHPMGTSVFAGENNTQDELLVFKFEFGAGSSFTDFDALGHHDPAGDNNYFVPVWNNGGGTLKGRPEQAVA